MRAQSPSVTPPCVSRVSQTRIASALDFTPAGPRGLRPRAPRPKLNRRPRLNRKPNLNYT